MGKRTQSRAADVITREVTVHLKKHIHKVTFKKRAPRAVKAIKAAAKKMMGTDDVRLDVDLNKYIWSRGIRHVPTRVRVRFCRQRKPQGEDEDALYTLVKHVPVLSFKGLQNETIEAEE